jgi:hypothetical protein
MLFATIAPLVARSPRIDRSPYEERPLQTMTSSQMSSSHTPTITALSGTSTANMHTRTLGNHTTQIRMVAPPPTNTYGPESSTSEQNKTIVLISGILIGILLLHLVIYLAVKRLTSSKIAKMREETNTFDNNCHQEDGEEALGPPPSYAEAERESRGENVPMQTMQPLSFSKPPGS